MLLVRSFYFLGQFLQILHPKIHFKNLQNQAVRCNSSSRLSDETAGFTLPSLLQDFVPNSLFLQKIKILSKMKVIQIKAKDFFEFIKLKDTSMWEIFSQMIDGEEKEIIFLDEEEKILFNYILPQNLEKLEEDRKTFAKEYADKISNLK